MATVEEPPVVVEQPSLVSESRVEPAPRIEPERRTELEPARGSPHRREAISRGVTAFGSAGGALLGLVAVVLSILALAGLLTQPLAAIAVITAGAALLLESVSLVATHGLQNAAEPRRAQALGGADTFAAVGAITLGVLALFGIRPLVLLPVAILALGAGMLFSGAAAVIERLRNILARDRDRDQDAVGGVAGVHLFVGATALVLGVLGVLGSAPVFITLIATLVVGVSLMMSGAALGTRVATA